MDHSVSAMKLGTVSNGNLCCVVFRTVLAGYFDLNAITQ